METERFYLTDSPFFFGIQALAYVLSVTLATITGIFAGYQILTLYLPYMLARLGGNSFKFPDYFYRVYGEEATELQLEHWGYLLSAVTVTLATFKFVAPDCPFKSTDRSAQFLVGAKDFFTSGVRTIGAVVRVAKRLAAVVAEEAKKID